LPMPRQQFLTSADYPAEGLKAGENTKRPPVAVGAKLGFSRRSQRPPASRQIRGSKRLRHCERRDHIVHRGRHGCRGSTRPRWSARQWVRLDRSGGLAAAGSLSGASTSQLVQAMALFAAGQASHPITPPRRLALKIAVKVAKITGSNLKQTSS
jgi:hypothetical protein